LFKRCDDACALICNGLKKALRGAVREDSLQRYLDELAFRIEHEDVAATELLKRLLDDSAYRQSIARPIRL
jgi:hypothetical protein